MRQDGVMLLRQYQKAGVTGFLHGDVPCVWRADVYVPGRRAVGLAMVGSLIN